MRRKLEDLSISELMKKYHDKLQASVGMTDYKLAYYNPLTKKGVEIPLKSNKKPVDKNSPFYDERLDDNFWSDK
jgi:hypothetical protein